MECSVGKPDDRTSASDAMSHHSLVTHLLSLEKLVVHFGT
jgi:hypothetical protein